MLKDILGECRNCDPWLLSFLFIFLANKCYERIPPGIHSSLRVKNTYKLETGRMLRLADSSAQLKFLETFKGSRNGRVVFFREKSGHKKVSKSPEQLSHGSRHKQKKVLHCRSHDLKMLYFTLRASTGNTLASTNNQELFSIGKAGNRTAEIFYLGRRQVIEALKQYSLVLKFSKKNSMEAEITLRQHQISKGLFIIFLPPKTSYCLLYNCFDIFFMSPLIGPALFCAERTQQRA